MALHFMLCWLGDVLNSPSLLLSPLPLHHLPACDPLPLVQFIAGFSLHNRWAAHQTAPVCSERGETVRGDLLLGPATHISASGQFSLCSTRPAWAGSCC